MHNVLDTTLLEALDLLSQGYTRQDIEQIAWDNTSAILNWGSARKHLWNDLGATSDIHAFRNAIERGLIQIKPQ